MPILKKIRKPNSLTGIGEARLSDSMALPKNSLSNFSGRKAGLAAVSNRTPTDASEVYWTVPLFERFPHLIESLKPGIKSNVVILMIDLSGFSTSTSSQTPDEIVNNLTPFYNKVVKEIEELGGVVEKFIGDAVIAAFGYPFKPNDGPTATTFRDVCNAIDAAKRCILWLQFQSNPFKTAKAAVTMGELFVGWVGPDSYSDLTMIGRPMTELFRLEDSAPDYGIIIPTHTFKHYSLSSSKDSGWTETESLVTLRGLPPMKVVQLVNRR